MSVQTLVNTPEFTIRGEFLWFGVILHADVHTKWSRGVRGRFIEAVQSIVKSINQPVFAFQAPSHDPKKRKFILDVGGTYDHRRLTGDGEWAEMFIFRPLDRSIGDYNGKTLWLFQKKQETAVQE